MSVAAKAEPKNDVKGMSDAEVVEAYLTASMIPDPEAASAYMKPGTIITFTGGREFDHPREPTGFNARRYRWVKKQMDRFDVCPGADETVVYSIGMLYGEWTDGTPFEGNRYVDRFVVRGNDDVPTAVPTPIAATSAREALSPTAGFASDRASHRRAATSGARIDVISPARRE